MLYLAMGGWEHPNLKTLVRMAKDLCWKNIGSCLYIMPMIDIDDIYLHKNTCDEIEYICSGEVSK